MSILTIVLIIALALIVVDVYKHGIALIFKGIILFLKSPVKAINAIKAKKANRVDKKEIKLRKKARDEYLNGTYLYSDEFTSHAEVKAYLDMKQAKANLKRHKESLKNKNK